MSQHSDLPRCANCAYWTGNRTQPQNGQCRRFPPQPGGVVMAAQHNILSPNAPPQPVIIWGSPEPNASHWCGFWEQFTPPVELQQ